MGAESWESRGNTHLNLDLKATMPYHEVIADLVCEHAPPDALIADLGCGLGRVEDCVLSRRSDIVFDVADAYEVCLRATDSLGNVRQRVLLDELTFDAKRAMEGPYDGIVMSHVLEHLVFPAQALDDVFSLIKPDGFLVVAVPNPVRPSVMISNLRRKHYVNRGHVHAWDGSHWRNFLENIMGFEVLEYRSDYVQLPLAARSSLVRSIGKALAKPAPWWGFSNIAVVRRGSMADSFFGRWKAATAER